MIGKGDIYHNNRSFIAENVDKERIRDNITIIKEPVTDVYHELFDKPLEEFNAKQNRKDRIIRDYHDHIRHSRQEKEFHEVIFQIGNKDDTAVGSDVGKQVAEILKEYALSFQQRNPHLRLFNAVVHLDEATPHVHLDFVPFATGQKRGLSTRVSLSKALEQQGFIGEGKLETNTKKWIESEKRFLSELMLSRNIEWEQKGTHSEHLSVLDFKKQERTKEIDALDKEIGKAASKVSRIKSVEDIAVKKTLIGDNVTVSRTDFENLSDMAKKQIASEKKEKKLKAENEELKQRIEVVQTENKRLKDENSEFKSIKSKLNEAGLKSELSELKRKFKIVMEFISALGFADKIKKIINNKDMGKENNI